ncbi:MAG: YjgN family protein [Burkholderiaceae bacterium]
MKLRNPFDAPPIRAAPLPGQEDPTGELQGPKPDPLSDSERPPPAPAGQAYVVEFLGTGAEYSRLWLLNLLLTLVTIGLYSPWAKVSQRRYLASRTVVGGVPFVYLGEPIPILKGRLLAVVLLAIGWAIYSLAPQTQPFVIILAILVAPWFLLQTFAFDSRNFSWRGIRLGYAARYRDAAAAVYPLLVWPIADLAFRQGAEGTYDLELLVPLLAYSLLWPWTVAAVTRLRLGGARYGTASAALDASTHDFYLLYFKGIGATFFALMAIGIIAVAFADRLLEPDYAALIRAVTLIGATAIALGYARGRRFNLALHRLVVGDRIRFRSTLEPRTLARLYLRNALWVTATFGLAGPWRKIRTIEMRARTITVYVADGFETIRPLPSAPRSASGEALAEGLSIDLSL